jgi:hypothetical protein
MVRNRYYRVVLEKRSGSDGPAYLFSLRKNADLYALEAMNKPAFMQDYKRARIERVGDGQTLDPRTGEMLDVVVLAYVKGR